MIISSYIKHAYLLIKFLKRKKVKQTYKNQYSGRCCVMANGPSLKDALKKYDEGEISITSDSVMVNLAGLDDHFWKIRPKHLCFSDSMFYRDYLPRKEDIKKHYKLLNEKVDWDLNLYLCYETLGEIEELKKYSGLTNPHIHFIIMNRIPCDNWDPKYWNRLLSSGYFMPKVGSVGNVALHVALLCGYKEIELYGVDNSQFFEFCINDDNQLCFYDSHFYDKEGERKLKPVISTWSAENRQRRISEFMYSLYYSFKGHEIHAQWAKYLGAHIVNCNPESMVDAHDRIGRDGKLHISPYFK